MSDDESRALYLRDVAPETLSRLEQVRAAIQETHPHRIVKRPEIAREALARGLEAMLDEQRVQSARKSKETP